MKIALCPPEWSRFQKIMSGESEDATYLIQKQIANRLIDQGHTLDFLAPLNLKQIVYTNDPVNPRLAPQTWSKSLPFSISSKILWRIQKLIGIPYLNLFSNYRLYDACVQCLPGHDIVYERHALYKVGVAMACKRLQLPYVLYFEADEIFEHDVMGKPITGLLRWRARQMMHYNLRAADRIICVSKPAKHLLIDQWNIPADKIAVFPNAVDTQVFKPGSEARAKIRSAIGIGNQPLIIFVGRFYIWHDTSTLLKSFEQVKKTYPDACLVMVGDGDHLEPAKTLANELQITQNVKFMGLVNHSEVPSLLAAADIAVVPYPAMEQNLWMSPLKLFEFMSAGVAVVASAVGQITEVLHDGVNGLLVPTGDVSEMAGAISRLIADPSLRRRICQEARVDAETKHSWDQYVSQLERVFIETIAEKSATKYKYAIE